MDAVIRDVDRVFGAGSASRIKTLVTTEPALTVFDVFNRPDDGIEIRIVGGAIRNALAARAPGDLDFATTAPPAETIRLADNAGLKALPTGIDHGTVTVIAGDIPVEITTLRQDVETHGRKATVAFGRDWVADAQRRDFTINALYADCDGHIHDPLGGADDLVARRLRFIGDADQRIREDYLRSIRYFRFLATFDATPDVDAMEAIARQSGGLSMLSSERVHKELFLLLRSPDPVTALAHMQAYGVLANLLASAPIVPRVDRLRAWEEALDVPADPLMRLAAIAVHADTDVVRLQERLRLAKAEAAHLFGLSRHWWRLNPDAGSAGLKEGLYRLGRETYRQRLCFSWLNTRQDTPDGLWKAAYGLPDWWTVPGFPVSGQDVVNAGVAAGPGVGVQLARLERVWIDSDYAMDRDALLKRIAG